MSKHKNSLKGFGAYKAVSVLVVLVLIAAGLVIYNHHKKTVAAKTGPYAILAPATVLSKTAECNDTTIPATAKNAINAKNYPVTCNGGRLNIAAWKQAAKLAGGAPAMMKLGYGATVAQVCKAYDARYPTPDIKGEVYELSAMYYGWHFKTDPIVTCVEELQ